MINDGIDFQLVTENIATSLDEKLRVVGYGAPSWHFIIIFSIALILVLIKQFAPARLKLVTSMFYQNVNTEKMTREWNPLSSTLGFLIATSYIALMALFIQRSVLIFSDNSILYGNAEFYLETCIFTAAFILNRHLIINIVGWMFNITTASQHHAITHLSMSTSMDFFFVVYMLIIAFYPTRFCVIVGVVVIAFFTTYRIIKTFFDIQNLTKGSPLNNFLYLCTLEILPISVAVTMVCRLIVTNSVL